MITFSQWLEAKFGDRTYGPYSGEDYTPERTAVFQALRDVTLGMHNELSNASPGSGIRVDFAQYLNILNDVSHDNYGRQYASGLREASSAIQLAARDFANALRFSQLGPGFQQAMEQVWRRWEVARNILNDILQNRDKSRWYMPIN